MTSLANRTSYAVPAEYRGVRLSIGELCEVFGWKRPQGSTFHHANASMFKQEGPAKTAGLEEIVAAVAASDSDLLTPAAFQRLLNLAAQLARLYHQEESPAGYTGNGSAPLVYQPAAPAAPRAAPVASNYQAAVLRQESGSLPSDLLIYSPFDDRFIKQLAGVSVLELAAGTVPVYHPALDAVGSLRAIEYTSKDHPRAIKLDFAPAVAAKLLNPSGTVGTFIVNDLSTHVSSAVWGT